MDDNSFAWSGVLGRLLSGEDLDEATAADALRTIMSGGTSAVETAAFLVALRAKGEAAAEIAGLVRAMLEHAERIDLDGIVVDTCGTGGDQAGTFNISTVAALVVAAAGVPVAKHGNRAASGKCGSADLLEAWGVVIDLPPEQARRSIDELGIGFLFARTFHPAMKHVAPVRAELGVPTVFNVLGPLTNPAGVDRQVVGVADANMAPLVAEALLRLGREHALVVRGEDGLDELTTTGPSRMWEIRDGRIHDELFDPASLGLERTTIADLQGGEVEDNVRVANAVLDGEVGPRADVVALNAAAALYVAGAVGDLRSGLGLACETLGSGAARELRDRWVELSRDLAPAAS